MTRSRFAAVVAAAACALTMSVPAVAPAAHSAATKKHCVKFKTYKKGKKSYKRCAKYSK